MPRGGMISWLTRMNSRIELITTMKSNLKTKIRKLECSRHGRPIEERDHVAGETQGVHLQQHLAGEEADEEQVGVLLEVVKPGRLMVVFSGQDTGVEEDQGHDQPEHPLGLADVAALSSHGSVPSGTFQIHFSSSSLQAKY